MADPDPDAEKVADDEDPQIIQDIMEASTDEDGEERELTPEEFISLVMESGDDPTGPQGVPDAPGLFDVDWSGVVDMDAEDLEELEDLDPDTLNISLTEDGDGFTQSFQEAQEDLSGTPGLSPEDLGDLEDLSQAFEGQQASIPAGDVSFPEPPDLEGVEPCQQCEAYIDPDLDECPHCGNYPAGTAKKSAWILIGLGLLTGVVGLLPVGLLMVLLGTAVMVGMRWADYSPTTHSF